MNLHTNLDLTEAQHHKLTTTYLKKHLCPLISRTQL